MSASARGKMADTGLDCLLAIAAYYELAPQPSVLRHEFGTPGQAFDDRALLGAARWIGLDARCIRGDFTRLTTIPLPAIAGLRDGGYVVLAGVRAGQVLISRAGNSVPVVVERAAFERIWNGGLILVSSRASASGRPRRFGFGWFLPYLISYRKPLGEVLAAAFVLQLLALATPLFFQVVIDKVLVHHGLTTLDVLAVGFFIVVVFEAVLGMLRTHIFIHTTSRIDVALGTDLFAHVTRLPLAYFQNRRVGDTVARLRELDSLRHFITGHALTLVVDIVFASAFVALMLHYSPRLTLVVLATVPAYVLLAAAVSPLLRSRLEEQFDRGADNHAFLVESVTGIETLKAAAVEPAMRRRWQERLAGHVLAGFRTRQLANVANEIAALLNKLMLLGILWLGAREVMAGRLSVGQLVAFNMIAGRMTAPLTRLIQMWQEFQQAGVSVRRLGDILDAPSEPGRHGGRSALPRLRGQISFEQVAFRYRPDGPPVLSDLSLSVAPGEVIGVVGRSGSGKSTLAKLLLRLYVPERGRVLVDGVDVALIDPSWLRRRVGVVVQDTMLFNRSVRENIALAAPALALPEVVTAARLAGAHDFILALPEGYDTVIGEHGTMLSGGQRQRIALARALAIDPRILILDEATSALDYEAEAVIQRHMRSICQGRTVFVIAHRLSALRAATRIIVVEQGRITAQGSAGELRTRSAYFAALCRLHEGPALAEG